jgi:hypothetical protein
MAREYAKSYWERTGTHDCAGVRGARRGGATEASHHDESKKEHREKSSCGVMHLRIVIKAPHRGQCQVGAAPEEASGAGAEAILRSWRQSASRSVRKRLARNPVANTHEALGQYVQKETPQKLDSIECHNA